MDYQLIFSNRKTVAIQITREGNIVVRAPKRFPKKEIEKFVRDHEKWILDKQEQSRERTLSAPDFTEEERKLYRKHASIALTEKAAYYADVMGVSYQKISIREQKTRWGSCSSKGNINFNWKLVLCPEEVQDYVVVHELAHLKEMNHSRKFYGIVEQILPDYKVHRRWLKENGCI